MEYYIPLAIFLKFLVSSSFAEDVALNYWHVPINVMNVTVKNSSLTYPDVLVLLPNDFPANKRAEIMEQLGVGEVDKAMELPGNSLSDLVEGTAAAKGVAEVLLEAVQQISKADNATINSTFSESSDAVSHMMFAVIPTEEEEIIRKRRSSERLAPLARQKRTLHKKKGCMICQMLQPKQPIIINVYKQGGCGNSCGGHYQPQPYHPPPQTCHTCNQPPPRPRPPPPPTCDPCSHQPQQQGYPSGGWSYSQSQSSASSGSWGKKK